MQVLSHSWVKMTNLPERGDSPGSPREDSSFKGPLADLLLGDTTLDDILAYVPDSYASNEIPNQRQSTTIAIGKSQDTSVTSTSSHRTSEAPSFVSSSSGSSSSLYQPINQSTVATGVHGGRSVVPKLDERLVKQEEGEGEGVNDMKRKARVLTTRTSSSSSSPAKKRQMTWTRFTHIEEVILVGAIMKRFFTKGSLTSSTSEDCWETIKAYYDLAWRIYSEREGVRTPQNRTKESLGRHFKFMKAKLSKKDTSARHLRHYFTEWETLNISLDEQKSSKR